MIHENDDLGPPDYSGNETVGQRERERERERICSRHLVACLTEVLAEVLSLLKSKKHQIL